MLKTFVFIAIGGALGAVMRFLSQATIYELVGKTFPYGTLFVNVTGSFLSIPFQKKFMFFET